MADTERPTPEARERIFAAAAHLFAERGYGSVSMREIAESAGVSKPMLYYYFDSKAGLCRALLGNGLNREIEATRIIISRTAPVFEKLRDLVRARFENVWENPDLVRLCVNFLHGPDETGLVQDFHALMQYALRVLVELIAEGQARGELRADIDPTVAAHVLVGAMNVHIGHSIFFGGPALDEHLADTIVNIFVNGVKAPETAA